MNFSFSEEEVMFKDAVKGSLERSVTPAKLREWSESGQFNEFEGYLSENGFRDIGLTEELGGQGGGVVEQMILFEELGRAVAPTDTLLSGVIAKSWLQVVSDQAPYPLDVRLTDPKLIACTSATKTLDRGVDLVYSEDRVTGKVKLVIGAVKESQLIIPLREDEDLVLLLADSWDAQITDDPIIDKTRRLATITFDKTPVRKLGRINKKEAQHVAAVAALLVAAESLGLSQAMLDMTVDYVKQRVQFGVPVGSFQAVKHSAAEAVVDIEAARSGIYYAAWALQNLEEDALLHAWIAHVYATQAGADVAERALKLHGAIGYTYEYDLQFYYKRARTNLTLLGSSKAYLERIADVIAPIN